MKPLLLTIVLIAMNSWGQSVPTPGRTCVLMAGVGCGSLIVNKTRRGDFLGDPETEKRFASQGLTFSFRPDEVLDTIVATSKDIKTNLGVRPGDREKQVRLVYGKPKVAKGALRKGDIEIGTVGDRILVYRGIRFVISKEKVWAIVIVPSNEGGL